MKFLNKLRLTYSIILVIPIICLGLFIFYSSNSFIRKQQVANVRELTIRNIEDLNGQMEQCEMPLLYLASNYSMQEFLNTEDEEYLIRNQLAKSVSPMVYNVLLSTPYFSKIQIYSEKNFSVANDLFKNNKEIKEEQWYQKTLETSNTLWWFEESKCFITRRITNYYPQKVIGVVRIDIKEQMYTDSFRLLSDMDEEILISDGETTLYCYGEEKNKPDYEETYTLSSTGWNVTYRLKIENFSAFLHPQIIGSMILIVILLGVVWILIGVCTKRMLKTLYSLMGQVQEIQEGNFDVEIQTESKDEIGDLAESIRQMIKKIRLLIDEVYQNKLDKKSLELNLLRAKINPHFLYNNLSAINWIAIENGEEQIYKITTLMATFYRTALNKGKNIDRLQIEIENIKAYIELQLIAHEYSFDVIYEIDESWCNTMIPTFIMQPLVENAIEHGIDQLREGRGEIIIKIFEERKRLYLQILDNGTALYEEQGEGFLKKEQYGYGLSNVDRRICLLYGEEYGVWVHAGKNGTFSEIRLKADDMILSTQL